MAGAAIDIGVTLLLVVMIARLGIALRSHAGGNAVNAAAWTILVALRIVALAVVYGATHRSAAAPTRRAADAVKRRR